MFEEKKAQVLKLHQKIVDNFKTINLDEKKKDLAELQRKQADPSLYRDIEKMRELNIEIKRLEENILPWEKILSQVEDLNVLIEIAIEEEENFYQKEIEEQIKKIETDYEKLEMLQLFVEETDLASSYLSIHPGAGGTESCDWAMMLYRMYTRWIEQQGFRYSVVDFQPGEEAGIKSATLFVQGMYAHGHLKSETGVHRLVRISPFDSNKRRHTSFCSVYSTPEIQDDVKVEINPADLKIDTYRSSGAGGQHVNTTDSAVRITHQPTKIVVTCQAERSQIQNRERAMKMLKSKLYAFYQAQKKAEINANAAEKKKIEWGSQIRSYVFHPYNLVKDHRSNFETSNTQGVMDGNIDHFIWAWLKLI